jgi:hypothetical protein
MITKILPFVLVIAARNSRSRCPREQRTSHIGRILQTAGIMDVVEALIESYALA